MAFEDLLVALRDDQFGQLRREKPFQPSDAAQFFNLRSDPRFETTVQCSNLLRALTQFTEQSCILHRDDSLVGKGAHQFDLPLGERLDPVPPQHDRADR